MSVVSIYWVGRVQGGEKGVNPYEKEGEQRHTRPLYSVRKNVPWFVSLSLSLFFFLFLFSLRYETGGPYHRAEMG